MFWKRKKKIEWNRLLVSVVVIQLIGIVGSIFSMGSIESWYQTLNKPWFIPPDWIFGPVWTALYLALGVGWYLIWIERKKKKILNVKVLFWVQICLNALWSPVFFLLRSITLGLLVIVSLWVVLVFLLKELWEAERRVFWLLIPYFGWVSFAMVLNLMIWKLN